MIPIKGGVADRLGIKFTGNPDTRDHCEEETGEESLRLCSDSRPRRKKKTSVLRTPGRFLVDPIS